MNKDQTDSGIEEDKIQTLRRQSPIGTLHSPAGLVADHSGDLNDHETDKDQTQMKMEIRLGYWNKFKTPHTSIPAMKIEVTFLLLALSCCYQDTSALLDGVLPGGGGTLPDVTPIVNCLKKAVSTDLDKLLTGLANFLKAYCDLTNATDANRDTARANLCNATKDLLVDVGCVGDEILQIIGVQSLEELLALVGDNCDKLVAIVLKTVNGLLGLNIADLILKVPCSLGVDQVIEQLRTLLGGLIGNLAGALGDVGR
ncbi:uncharacterized protein LOC115097626 [Rhinatrema bivittatum]|uniref:uncharacterized protein LOC115097626 n=1 Tax=Rhinatrema bivittatum TaxID=194408 RepID=UPI001127677B|nr:uncharacterized protein LOC115097626 [Rhinatrema bivittatum]